MKNFYCKSRLFLGLVCLTMSFGLLSCNDSGTDGNSGHNPDQPIQLESFFPKTGPIATQVIIRGKNFGTNPKDIDVYFNEKKAVVISSTGDRMLVLAPRLPGDDCVISVSIGENKAHFEDYFDYKIQTTVSTLVGGMQGASSPSGTTALASAQFAKQITTGMAIDGDDNIFMVLEGTPEGSGGLDQNNRIYMINEEAGSIKAIQDIQVALDIIILGYDYKSKNVHWYHANMSNEAYGFFSPTSDFVGINMGSIVWDKPLGYTSSAMAFWTGRRSIAMNPVDNQFYFYSNEGTVGRFNPATGEGENLTTPVFKDAGADSYVFGIVFDPNDPDISYFSVQGRHCIYKHNIKDGTCVVWAGRKDRAGFLDGALDEAQFNEPCQMCADDEYIYVADSKNHCIRKISFATGYVSTHAGTAKTSGYTNGLSANARFNEPTGLVIDSQGVLFVGDKSNYAIRRVATE